MSYLRNFLKEESEDLASGMLPLSLFVIHDTISGSKHDVAELTRREQISSELLESIEGDVESRGDDTALVETTDEINDNLS